jgi:hypothetical protein
LIRVAPCAEEINNNADEEPPAAKIAKITKFFPSDPDAAKGYHVMGSNKIQTIEEALKVARSSPKGK